MSWRKSRARRVLGTIGGVVGTAVTFVAATATAAVVNLDARPTKRLVTAQANHLLEGAFAGRITVERIGGLGLGGVKGVRVRLRDPEGRQVLFADGVRVVVHGLDAARSALLEKGPIRIKVDLASIDHVDASIDADPGGKKLRILDALAPKKKEEEAPQKKKEEAAPGRGVLVDAPDVELHHAWIHGAPPGAPPIDADVVDLRAGGHVDPETTNVDVGHVAFVTRGMPRGVDPRGAIAAHARIPSKGDAFLMGTLEGAIAGIPTTAVARMDGSRVDARLDVARATGDRLRSVVGDEIAPRADAELHAEAHGVLPKVDAAVRLRLGRGTVDVDGTVVTGPNADVRATIAARHLDAGALVVNAPVTDLGLDGSAHVNLGQARRGEVSIDTLPGTVDRDAIPAAHVRGAFARDAAWAGLRIAHPDMPTDIAVAMTSEGEARVVDAVVRADVPDLARVPKLGRVANGAARVRGRGRVNLATKDLVARVEVDGSHLEQGGRRVGAMKARIDAKGTIAAPLADAEIQATDVAVGPIVLDRAEASARVGRRETIVVTDPRALLVRGKQIVRAGASHVTIGAGTLHAADIAVDGFGQPLRAAIDQQEGELRIQLDAPAVDLTKAAAFAGQRDVRSGLLTMNGDVIVERGALYGELHADVEKLAARRVEGASGRIDARFFGEDVDVALQAALGKAGHASLVTDGLVLGGAATDPESWRNAKGRVDVEADVSLDRVAELVPPGALPVGELRGELVVRGAGWRRSEAAPPRLHVTAYTRGLVMAGKVEEERRLAPGTRVMGVAPWRSQDFDLQLDARIDPDEGTNELAIRLHDPKGIVVALDAKAPLPVADLMAHPEAARARLADVPISAKVFVPERKLSTMPTLAGVKNVGGSVAAMLDVSGTPAAPQVELVVKGRQVRAGWLPRQLATDDDLRLTYDGKTARLEAKVRAEGRDVLAVASHVDVAARDLAEGRTPDWEAAARVDLDRFPLESLNVFADRRVKGLASGHVAIDGLHRDARLDVDIGLDHLKVGRAQYTKGRITAHADAARLVAETRIEQSDGWLASRGEVPISWGAAIVPSVDPNQPVHASLGARNFRIAALAPFVQGPLNRVDGSLDADANVLLGGGKQEVAGHLVLRDGRVQVAALGEELTDVRADVTMQRDGTVLVRDVSARGTEGELTAQATVKTQGFALASADGEIHIPKPLDFALQGEPIGQLSGDVKIHAQPSGDRMTIVADVPKLRAELPQSMRSGLQDMAPPTNIRAGVYRSKEEFVRLPLDKEDLDREKAKEEPKGEGGTPIDVDVKLGEVTVVRGNQVRVVLTGHPHVTADDKTRVSGQIQLERGRIDVQGKEFEIEHGTVTFQPDQEPSNPTVVATASWTAADGTKVFADFVGPVKTGKVNLRSEPPRPKNEILALILFGTADGMNGAPAPPGRAPDGTTKAAVGIGGGFAAQGLTEALDDLAGIQATARIDTTESNNPRPEVEVQIATAISVAFGHVLGNPPISEPDRNLVMVDWRFLHNWSLETTFGDRGRATLDAIWQKRY